MLRIQGLGPKKIKVLFEKLKIKSIPELKSACEQQRLRAVEGFGAKTEENILKSILHFEKNKDKYLYPQAFESAQKIVENLREIKGVKYCEYAGSLRRKKEIIGDIDILICGKDNSRKDIFAAFKSYRDIDSVVSKGETKASAILKNGINCDLRVVKESEYPFALIYFTGSKEHNVEMRSLARKQGWSLNEYGFTKLEELKSSKPVKRVPSCGSEEEIYAALGLHYIPPELRENTGEIEFAIKYPIPELIDYKDIRVYSIAIRRIAMVSIHLIK